ncbi:hypothetical protein ES332_D09G284300v1 [Gossypium tomentosum]|uniref:F-box domain-containing protein n=1 Tax=Gossypium tomentosum TaxID=34277 RepID=A0A5D2JNQ3_GOSTO|nr:hypothetical protein ES332_D09G284300v1 [Gossypium tomentosum]
MCVEDRISNFSDHILCHILSFLPIKEAVRTSIISTKWRNLFASISIIEFDGDLLRRLTDRNIDSFKNFVDRLLKFPDQVSLDCFRLHDGISSWNDGISSWNDGDHDFDVSGWICAALCRGVKEIDLKLYNLGDVPPDVPPVLFTCHSLVNLTLVALGFKIEVPSDVCLGNLKTFYLESVFVCDSINRLISNCHVLEDLAFMYCSVANASELNIQSPSLKELTLYFDPPDIDQYSVVINAPNLVYFRYGGDIVRVYPLGNMKSLEKAQIYIWFGSETNAAHLYQGICNIRSLTLQISKEIFPTSRLPIFHNLIELEFDGDICFVEFLHCMPNLKKLILKYLELRGNSMKALRIKIPSCLSFHLKEIEIEIPRIDTLMIEMVSYFLDNALVLERLIISMDYLTSIEKRKARNQLLQLLKSSKKCLIMIL